MRWPIYLQLLVPMVSVVVLTSVLATAITAYRIALRVRNEQKDDLRRVARTLAEARFPLTEQVLRQMSGLSGAEFVLTGADNHLQEATLPVEAAQLEEISRASPSRPAGSGARNSVISLGGRNWLVDSVAVRNRSSLPAPATLYILYREDQLTSRIHQAVLPALLAGVLAAATAMVITTWLARRLARRIDTLVQQTSAIAQGRFTPMPVPRRNDEFRDLAESINHMTEQLADYERQVRYNERLRTLGQLGAAMAHQLRNAATGGRMAVELHRRDCPAESSDESLEVALRQFRLMESYLRQFLSIGSPEPAATERVEVAVLVDEVLGLLRPSYAHAGVELEFRRPARSCILRGQAEPLRQLVTNLVLNALEAARTGGAAPGRVLVDLALDHDRAGVLCVQDSGPGPPVAVRDKLFESFVTTKPDGVGLGLFVARQVAESHGGRLRWERRDGITCFIFEFPLAAL